MAPGDLGLLVVGRALTWPLIFMLLDNFKIYLSIFTCTDQSFVLRFELSCSAMTMWLYLLSYIIMGFLTIPLYNALVIQVSVCVT